jgi:hypothetical protein
MNKDRFLVCDAEGYELAVTDGLHEALEAARHWKHLMPPNGPSDIYVVDKDNLLLPIKLPGTRCQPTANLSWWKAKSPASWKSSLTAPVTGPKPIPAASLQS